MDVEEETPPLVVENIYAFPEGLPPSPFKGLVDISLEPVGLSSIFFIAAFAHPITSTLVSSFRPQRMLRTCFV